MSNLHSLTQALEKKKAELEKLQLEVEEARQKELTALPQQVGLESVDALIKALAPFASPRMKGLLSGAASAGRKTGAVAAASEGSIEATGREPGQRKRARITDEMKEQVKKMVEDGKSAAEIAKTVGISAPSVANIKKALGLTKKRGK